MSRRPVILPPSVLPLAKDRGRPLRWRLHQGLKAAILSGQLAPGARLPSTRALAASLGISRSTVVEAFDQLFAEGFVERRAGSGSYVSHQLGAVLRSDRSRPGQEARKQRRLARRLRSAQELPAARPAVARPGAFAPCEPDAALFPHQLWARMLARHARAPKPHSDDFDPAGLPRLRQAIAAHLALSRGVMADPEQVIVVLGARQGLHLCAQTLLDPGDRIWCEDPGYAAARAAFRLAGACLVPVSVADAGIDVDAARRVAPDARAAYVTPSHQFPTGVVMSLGRRLQLLDWAAERGAWILEDDYDSEFCYDSRPLPALQGIDDDRSVVYIGTLNKITYPGLRIGYLVPPRQALGAFAATAAIMSLTPPLVVQAAAADFIAEGHLAQHITRARAAYRERRQLFICEITRQLAGSVSLPPASRGMHVLAELRHASAVEVAARGAARGMHLRALPGYAAQGVGTDSLVIGYTYLQPSQIETAVTELAQLLHDAGTESSRR